MSKKYPYDSSKDWPVKTPKKPKPVMPVDEETT
jgi:hypothetical protein